LREFLKVYKPNSKTKIRSQIEQQRKVQDLTMPFFPINILALNDIMPTKVMFMFSGNLFSVSILMKVGGFSPFEKFSV